MAKVCYGPVGIEILWTRLLSIVDEAATAFERTSFSNLARESNDYSVIITDVQGRLLAQNSFAIPSFIGTLPRTVGHFLKRFPLKTLKPDDFLLTNDPWLGSGHLPDVNSAMPIFQGGRPVAMAAMVSHVADIGGRPLVSGTSEIYDEGLRLSPVKLVDGGAINETLVEVIRDNVRTPELTLGDIWGQATALKWVARRLTELLDETGADIDVLGGHIRRRTERAMRGAIRKVPNGSYLGQIIDDGFDGVPLHIRARVDVADETIAVDFSGSSPQLPKAVNVVPAYAYAWTAFALKSILLPELPNNDGAFRPISTSAPAGSVVNPHFPAACNARHGTGHLIPPAIMAALSEVLPDRVLAAPGSPLCTLTLAGTDAGRRFSSVSFITAGLGASAAADGLPVLAFPTNVSNTPIELLEAEAPIRVWRRAIRRGSGGAGARRGGDGGLFEFEICGEAPLSMAFMMNRLNRPAAGLRGGEPGVRSALRLNGRALLPDEPVVVWPGDRVFVATAGGGGFGPATPAAERQPAKPARARRQPVA